MYTPAFRRSSLAFLFVVSSALLATSNTAAGQGASQHLPATRATSGIVAPLDRQQAARFLTQATFGPTLDGIQDLIGLGGAGNLGTWIDDQIALPPTLHLPATRTLVQRMCGNYMALDGEFIVARNSAWWATVIYSEDQLRQRVAFALSEILVTSEMGALRTAQYGLADYYDVLVRNALGNYRDLLGEVTRHPAMGRYLSMLRNERANPLLNIAPDENFAREILQLFSIGVNELNPDGTLVMSGGAPVPTYGQSIVREFARVFTGWSFANISWTSDVGNGDHTQPMIPFPQFHDSDAKTLLGGTVVPSGLTVEADLDAALDNIFAHANVGPFVTRRLIQRLVTSNPTPAYVGRVAAVFADDGQGLRGNLAAVVRAILLDREARYGHLQLAATFGKVREPLLRLSHLRRAFDVIPITRQGPLWSAGSCGQGTYEIYFTPSHIDRGLGQRPLGAPSVFNFFQPGYTPLGPVATAGLVAPELQIADEATLPGTHNLISYEIQASDTPAAWVILSTLREQAMAHDTDALLTHLDLLLLSGEMSVQLRQSLLGHLDSPVFPSGPVGDQAKARDAIMLIATSPEYSIQK